MEQSSLPENSHMKSFWSIVIVTYLMPVVLFALLLTVMKDASSFVKYLLTIVTSLGFMGLGLWGLRTARIPTAQTGLTWIKTREALGLLAAAQLAFAAVLVAIALLSGGGLEGLITFSLPKVFVQWLFVGMGEEILFRGYLLNWFTRQFVGRGRRKSLAIALVLTNLIFSSMHLPQRIYQVSLGEMQWLDLAISMGIVFLLGLVFSYIALRSQNIVLAGLAHGALNAPWIGANGNILALVVTAGCLELYRWFRSRRKAVLPKPAL